MKLFRKYIGKLNWLCENTWPDLAIWRLNLSKRTSIATIGDLKRMNQIVKKIQSWQSKVKFSKIGEREDFIVQFVADASYKYDSPCISGNLIMLGNKKTN